MQQTLRTSLLTTSALATALTILFSAPAAAQQVGSDRLTIREAPAEIEAAKTGLQDRLAVEVDTMRDHAEAIRRGLRDLERCTAAADLAGPDASVSGMLDCFVTQAISNEQVLTDWSGTLGRVGTVLTDASGTYSDLSEAKATEIEAVRGRLQALETERAELGRRIDRVKAFVAANGAQLNGDAAHEARGLRLAWLHLTKTEDHHMKMIALMDEARRQLDLTRQRLQAASRETMGLRQEFANRATQEAYYIAEVGEAAQLNVALEQAGGMMAGMAQMGQTLVAMRVAMAEAGSGRPDPVIGTVPDTEVTLFGDGLDQDGLIEFFRTVETGGQG